MSWPANHRFPRYSVNDLPAGFLARPGPHAGRQPEDARFVACVLADRVPMPDKSRRASLVDSGHTARGRQEP